MNETTVSTPPSLGRKPRREKAPLTTPSTLPPPRAERKIDERILEFHAETKAKVAQYRADLASAALLERICDKYLPRMNEDDKGKLKVALDLVVTLPLPMT